MDQDVEDSQEHEVNKIYGRCRCCLEYSYVKDIWTEYLWEGAHEIYGEMLMETFSIAWDSIQNEKEQICDMCVRRLRDAHMFKREVLASEQLLKEEAAETESESVKAERLSDLDQYENTTEYVIEDPEFKAEVEHDDVQYEEEFVTEEVEYEEVEYLEEDIVTENASDAKELDPATGESSKQELSVYKPKRKRTPGLNTRNYKNYSEDTLRRSIEMALNTDRSISEVAALFGVPRKTLTARVYNAKHTPKPDDPGNSPNNTPSETKRQTKAVEVDNYTDNDMSLGLSSAIKNDPGDGPDQIRTLGLSSAIKDGPRDGPDQIRSQKNLPYSKREHDKHRDNIKSILTWSNATPFITRGSVYRCFFCGKEYFSTSDLKNHTTLTHIDTSKAYNFRMIYFKRYIDITDLKCLVCEESIDSFELLLTHLKKHGKVIHADINNHIIPFKFDTDELKCCLCDRVFQLFKQLRDHMAEHYRNYECDNCNKTFIYKNMLIQHKKLSIMCGLATNIEVDKNIQDKAVAWSDANDELSSPDKEPRQKQLTSKGEVIKFRENAKTILTWSNATPFKARGSGFACLFCDEEYSSTDDLKNHNTLEHMDKLKGYNFKFICHTILKIDITGLKCLICETSIDSFEYLLTHLKDHGKIIHMDIKSHIIPFKFDSDKFKCVRCDKVFDFMKLLIDHMCEHYRNYECDECGRPFLVKSSLSVHKSRHKKGEFKCGVCAKVFNSKPQRDNHRISVHVHSNKSHKCWKCDILFPDGIHRAKHDVESHGAKPRTFVCNACERTFKSQKALRVHKNSYHLMYKPLKSFECSECGRIFSEKRKLANHTVTHTGVKNVKCLVCNKTFGHSESLRVHMRTHNRDGKFQCKLCSKKFCLKLGLENHMKITHN